MNDRFAQLERWGARISELSDEMLTAGTKARFDELLDVDELKALHAIAQTRFDAFRASTGPEREALGLTAKNAWIDLAAAFERHRSRRQKDRG